MRIALSPWAAVPLRCFIGTLIAFIVLNLPYQFSEFAPVSLGDPSEFKPAPKAFRPQESEAIFGGWPWRYVSLLSPQDCQTRQWSQASWSLTSLVANASVALASAGALAFVVMHSTRLATAMVATALLGLVGYGGYQSSRDLAVANRLAPYGIVYRSAIVPAWLPRFVSSYSLRAFSRTRGVMLHRYDAAAAAEAVNLPNLRSLGFWRIFPANDQLRPLMLHARLQQLAVFDAELDDMVPQFIATQSHLRHLELIGCRGLASGLAEIDGRIELHSFDVTNSDFPISTLSDSVWGQQLRYLKFSHPASGKNRLELRNYHQLESLFVGRPGGSLNADVLTLWLDTVPKLRVFALVSTQKLHLSIINAPRLQELRVVESEEQLTGVPREHGPVNLWLERLRLVDTPSLRKIGCYGLDLRSIEIRDAPSLIELAIDSLLYGSNPLNGPIAAGVKDFSGLIADLAACDGPPVIDLSTLPLQDLDLSPLTKNKRIRELRLAGTGINGAQLRSLLALPRLTALDVRYNPISNADAADILTSQPQLKKFQIHPEDFRRIEIVDRSQLVKFASTPIPRASVVRISGSPHLDSELLLGDCIEELSIRDAGALRGISIDGPVPQNATLQGLRDLRFCALGGPTVNDRLCVGIWRCLKLDHLTLAHARLSRQAISNIRHLRNLSTLILPGCDIDDSVTSDWDNLRRLREVDLSYTAISTQTLDLILSRPNLQRLAINHVDLQPSDLRGLPEVGQLIELEVAGIGLEEQTLRALTDRGMLDRLDLSDCELGPEIIRILTSDGAHSLIFLGIRNCGLDEAEIRSIISALPQVAVDIQGNPVSDAFRKELSDSDRLLSRRDRRGFLRRIAHGGRPVPLDSTPAATAAAAAATAALTAAAAGDTARGRIDVHQFAIPRPVTASR